MKFCNPSPKWIEEADSLWIELEEINAVMLDEKNEGKTIESFETEIVDIVSKLSVLISKFH